MSGSCPRASGVPRQLYHQLFVVCLTALYGPVLLAPASDPIADEEAERLASDEFADREVASKRLEAIGEAALAALHQAANSDDTEVRHRAAAIVAVIEDKLSREQLRLTGHIEIVRSVSVSADGERLLTGSEDKTLRLWDADTGKCLSVFEGHTEGVNSAALSPDGKRVLSGGSDKTVRLWDAATGKQLQKMTGHTFDVIGVAFGPEVQAISGSNGGTMRLWDLNTGKRAGVFRHTGHVRVAYSDKAKLAATCSIWDQSIRLWNLETGKEVRKITGQRDYFNIMSVCNSPGGKQLLAAEEHEFATLRIWDVETGKDLKQIQAHGPRVNCAVFSPDGKRIASGGEDGVVRLWDAATGKELRKYQDHTDYVIGMASFADGQRITSASADGTAHIWRAPR